MSVTWRGPSGGEGLSEVKNKKKVNIYLMGYEALHGEGSIYTWFVVKPWVSQIIFILLNNCVLYISRHNS